MSRRPGREYGREYRSGESAAGPECAPLLQLSDTASRQTADSSATALGSLVRSGVPARVAMKLTGHKTRSVFDRYDVVSPNDLRVAVERLDAVPVLVRKDEVGRSGETPARLC